MANLSTNQAATTLDLGGDLTVRRLGFGAMRITGPGIWGEPADHDDAIATLRRAVELGVNFVDTPTRTAPSSASASSPKRSVPIQRIS
jgi:pyridoxine 4-dehydrogenase